MSETNDVRKDEDAEWEVIQGAHSGDPREFSVWIVGAGGDGTKRIACWIRTKEIADRIVADHNRPRSESDDMVERLRDEKAKLSMRIAHITESVKKLWGMLKRQRDEQAELRARVEELAEPDDNWWRG